MMRGILVLGCLCALGGFCVALRLATQEPPPCPIDMRDETADKLKIGMTELEFAAILGGPADDYRTRVDIGYIGVFCGMVWIPDPECVEREWLTDDRAFATTRFGLVPKGATLPHTSWHGNGDRRGS